jgi:hypothetical protein
MTREETGPRLAASGFGNSPPRMAEEVPQPVRAKGIQTQRIAPQSREGNVRVTENLVVFWRGSRRFFRLFPGGWQVFL